MTNDKTQTGAAFASLAGQQYILLTTFRKNGDAVPTIVWFAQDQDKLYITTPITSGKVKRLRNSGKTLVAPSTSRGVALGKEIEAQARLLPDTEQATAKAVLKKKYGFMYQLFSGFSKLRRVTSTIIEVTPT